MTINIDKHLAHLKDDTTSLKKKIEIIHILWAVAQSVIDREFGDDAVQLAREDADDIFAPRFRPALSSNYNQITQSQPTSREIK